jgi:pimeloyl-ACP methyl ester carboxylesterase
VSPNGNEPVGDGWEWRYFPEDRFAQAVDVVDQAATGCDEVIIDGFSNGGAFAAKLYCRGETLDGRLRGVVVDDPVVDHATEGCAPDPIVNVALYWTGALEPPAVPGWECAEGGWTCEGGTTVGIDAYAAALATEILPSPFEDHQWYLDAPELTLW